MQINRRDFITLGSLATFSLLLPKGLRAGATILEKTSGKVLVPIFLRGGMDGLSLFVPHGEPNYYEVRKATAIAKPNAENGALDLNGMFGLNPRAKSLLKLFKNNSMTVLHGVGNFTNTRSHFTEQDVWETGDIKNYIRSEGLMNKFLMNSQNPESVLRAISFGETLPRMLRGTAQTFSIRNIDDLLVGKGTKSGSINALEKAYQNEMNEETPLIQQAGSNIINGLKEIKAVLGDHYETKIAYPNSPLGRQLKDAARMIKSKLGLEVVHIDIPGWDTHQNQGSVTGNYGNKVQDLADSLLAFYQDLENKMDDVLILVFSEFGRTVKENGTNGTDHGWGNNVIAIGASIPKTSTVKNKFLNDWPGINQEQLNQGRDIKDTIDFRNLFAEAFLKHMGLKNINPILPDLTYQPAGLLI